MKTQILFCCHLIFWTVRIKNRLSSHFVSKCNWNSFWCRAFPVTTCERLHLGRLFVCDQLQSSEQVLVLFSCETCTNLWGRKINKRCNMLVMWSLKKIIVSPVKVFDVWSKAIIKKTKVNLDEFEFGFKGPRGALSILALQSKHWADLTCGLCWEVNPKPWQVCTCGAEQDLHSYSF